MSYLKPYWTLEINHVILDEEQRLRLSSLELISKKTKQIHINQLAKRYKCWYIEYATSRQVKKITAMFESIWRRFKDGKIRKTQVWWGYRFPHN
jgi:hypothetical protein